MTFLKRLIVLAVVVIVGVTTRLVVRYGVDGALDLLLNAAHAQPTESDVPATVKPRAHKPAAANPAATAGAQPALTPAAPIGAGPINAARKAAAAENAQLAAQTGQPVPAAKGPAPHPASQAPSNPTPVIQQGAPKTVAAKTDSAKPTATVAAAAAPKAAGPATGTAANRSSSTPATTTTATTAAKPAASVAATGAPAAANSRPAPTTATVAPPSDSAKAVVMRETFDYQREGRRDPFVSLMTTSDLRPTLSDLTLKGVLYDLSGRRPIAILRDQVGGQWRVTTGMTLGRMRVAQIKPRAVIFTIEEFGFSRQDSLLLGDTTRARSR